MKINGLNIQKGIERFGGNADIYFNILRSYVTNTASILNSIKNVSPDTMNDYAIIVHGIKGANRNISADVIADIAERLENAAKAGDFEYISANNPSFLNAAWQLISSINQMMTQAYPDSPKPKKEKPDMNVLKKLLDACKRFDVDEIDSFITELDSYEYESGGDFIDELLKSANQYHYKEIKEKLIAQFNKEEA